MFRSLAPKPVKSMSYWEGVDTSSTLRGRTAGADPPVQGCELLRSHHVTLLWTMGSLSHSFIYLCAQAHSVRRSVSGSCRPMSEQAATLPELSKLEPNLPSGASSQILKMSTEGCVTRLPQNLLWFTLYSRFFIIALQVITVYFPCVGIELSF